ncbi:MAG: hypothetical protein MAG715_00509 [Methanonatronarchaeales archaeon]|nr:hypothetical protein [Methanonatronarchaeales archaeon]
MTERWKVPKADRGKSMIGKVNILTEESPVQPGRNPQLSIR